MWSAENRKNRMAPYVSSVALQKLFQRVKNRNMPQFIDEGLLQDFGIPRGNVYALLSALKFLNLVDDSGRLTENFPLVQKTGEEFQRNLAELVRKAYAPAFARLDLLQDTREQIRNFFARNYSSSQADKATSLFLFLCQEAGIPLGEHLLTRGGGRPKAEPPPRRREVPVIPVGDRGKTPPDKQFREAPPPVTAREATRSADLREQYARKLIESEMSITVAPGVEAEALREAKELLQMRHRLIKEVLREIDRLSPGGSTIRGLES
jgi:hypothetical protein